MRRLKTFDPIKRRTVQQYHSDHAFPPDAKCGGCKQRRPIARALLLAPLDEAVKRGMIAVNTPPAMLATITVKIKDGSTDKSFIRVSTAYACETCLPTMERTLAKAPSWCIAEIHRGPNPTNAVSVALKS